ncbi:MAG TPA: cytochrome P450 [Chloroflexia bacterium]|nr:cytochrome P450 [Chloroflexia bacterium]
MAASVAIKPIPQLSAPPLIGSMKEMQRDRLALYMRAARECGDTALIRIGPYRFYVFNTPEMAQAILVDHANDFDKGFVAHKAFTPVIGNGLINNEGESWRKQRKLMAPVFTHRHIASYADTMVGYTERIQQTWADGVELRIDQEMTRLTMSIVGKTLFDADVFDESDGLGQAVTRAMEFLQYTIGHLMPVPLSIPTPRSRRTKAALAVIRERLQAEIDQRRASGTDRGDLLSLLLAARDEHGAGMDDTQIRNEAVTLFMAGHETTANTLAWCWYFLARYPETYAKLQAEVDRVLGGRPATVADLPQLPYALQVFKEALRLYPAADSLSRQAVRDMDLQGYPIQKGDLVAVPIYTLHRRPEFYPDPERFDPERFTPENEKRLPRYAYLPFGGGPRVCIGNHFAMMEGQLILATLAQHVTFDLVPGQDVVPTTVFVVRQKDGCRVTVRRRDGNRDRAASPQAHA